MHHALIADVSRFQCIELDPAQLAVRDIPKLDTFSLSDPCVAMFNAATGVELGRTETIWNVRDASFQTTLSAVLRPARSTTLEFVVVDIDAPKTHDLSKQDLVGKVRVDLESLVFQSQGHWVALPIIHRRPKSGTLLLRVYDIRPGETSALDLPSDRRTASSPAILQPITAQPVPASTEARPSLVPRNSFDERTTLRFAKDWSTRDAVFQSLLASRGWREIPVLGDGACFFRAVSVSISGSEDGHGELRQQTMDYVLEHSEVFAPFILEPLHAYVERKRRPGEYANNLEIQAVSCLLERNVEVYRYSLDPITVEPFISEDVVEVATKAPVRVTYVHENVGRLVNNVNRTDKST